MLVGHVGDERGAAARRDRGTRMSSERRTGIPMREGAGGGEVHQPGRWVEPVRRPSVERVRHRAGELHDQGSEPHEEVRRQDRCPRPELHGPARHRDRFSRSQRCGQVHHHADDHRPGRADIGGRDSQRAALRRPPGTAPRGRRPARGACDPYRPDRREPPPRDGGDNGHRAAPRRRGDRPRRAA